MATTPPKPTIPLTIQHIEKLSRGRFRVKLAENDIGLNNMRINNRDYDVVQSLGRGRFVIRAAANQDEPMMVMEHKPT